MMKATLERKLNQWWYGKRGAVSYLLWPLSCLYRLVLWLRKSLFCVGLLKTYRASVPVVVVGNITLGGVGKTPVVAAFAQHLMQQGKRVGVVSRGFAGQASSWPQQVTADSDPAMVGDEPVMLAQQLGCCVVVSPKRVDAIRVCEQAGCDIIISDDGLSHYYFARDKECILIDGSRGLGNGFCLPAGPLRESAARLKSVSLVLTNSQGQCDATHFYMKATELVSLSANESLPVTLFKNKPVHAVSAIGNNARFFQSLQQLGYKVTKHPHPDHYPLSDSDVSFKDELPVIITEKDAVKCSDLAGKERIYVLRVRAVINPTVYEALLS